MLRALNLGGIEVRSVKLSSLDSACSAARTRWPFRTFSVVLAVAGAVAVSITAFGAKYDPQHRRRPGQVHRNRAVSAAGAKIAERLQPGCDADTLRLVQLALDL